MEKLPFDTRSVKLSTVTLGGEGGLAVQYAGADGLALDLALKEDCAGAWVRGCADWRCYGQQRD
jgi:hypothetical protein